MMCTAARKSRKSLKNCVKVQPTQVETRRDTRHGPNEKDKIAKQVDTEPKNYQTKKTETPKTAGPKTRNDAKQNHKGKRDCYWDSVQVKCQAKIANLN